jgi:DNA-binding NarL/FixJ family response regulator
MSPLRVVIADDQPMMRAGFKAVLEATGDIAVVAEAGNGEEAVRAATEHAPDVVLMDIRMPGIDGIEATRRLPRQRVLILTTFGLDEYIIDALRAGASGFLLKDAPTQDVDAVRSVAAGDAVLSPAVTRQLLDQVGRRLPAAEASGSAAGRQRCRAAPVSAVRSEEEPMTVLSVLDAAGRRRSPATMPGYHAGRPPRNKGIRYPADPPTVDEIVAAMRHAGDDRHGWRVRAMIVVLWRAGLRIQEALALTEHDLDQRRGSILVRSGKGGRRREVGMDEWGFEQVRSWLAARAELPVGPLFCVIDGPTRGRPWSGAAVRHEFRRLAAVAGIRRRFAPHQLRHAHALELAREGVPLNIIQRQLGHVNLGTTSIYLQGIDPEEIITAVRTRRAPMMSASAGLRL